MKPKDAAYVFNTIESEGFDYAFVHYSDFEEVKDEEFHRLREAFLNARQTLKDYLGCEG